MGSTITGAALGAIFCVMYAARRAALARKRTVRRIKAIKVALRTFARRDAVPVMGLAASDRLKKQASQPRAYPAAKRAARNRGFAIAPILYLLGLIGVGAGVLYLHHR
jgi:hypothetical protein